jgi:hypothetical protein
MTIEIHQPELAALIQQRMASGAFRDLDELLTKALGSLEAAGATVQPEMDSMALVDVFEPVRGLLTDQEVDVLFSRKSSVSRTIDLS